MLALLAAVLFASNASGKAPVRTSPGTILPVSDSSTLAWFPFTVPGCYPSGSAMGTKGQTITVSRAGTRTCNVAAAGAAPQLVTCQANEACVEASGLLVEPTRSPTPSTTFNWTANTGGASPYQAGTPNSFNAPDGTASADPILFGTVAALNNTSAMFRWLGSVANGIPITVSLYVMGNGQSGTIWHAVEEGNSGAWKGCTACPYTDGVWSRCVASFTTDEGIADTYYHIIGNTYQTACPGSGASGSKSVVLALSQGEVNAAYATAWVPSGTRNADVVSITNPLAATNPSSWCVEGTYTPENGRAWNAVTNARLLSSYTGTATNIFILSEGGWASTISWDTYGSDSASKRLVASPGWAAGSSRRIQVGSSVGTPALFLDGVSAGTSGGAGAGGFSGQGATIGLGGPLAGDAGAPYAGVGIKDLKIHRRPCR